MHCLCGLDLNLSCAAITGGGEGVSEHGSWSAVTGRLCAFKGMSRKMFTEKNKYTRFLYIAQATFFNAVLFSLKLGLVLLV